MKPRKRIFQSDRHLVFACKWWHPMKSTVPFFAVLILLMATSVQPSAAQTKQDFLAANIDPTVSPREDFFQYANGGWFKRNPFPENYAVWGISNVANEEILVRQRKVCDEAAAKKAPRGSIEQLVGDFWFTAMDVATVNKQGLAPLRRDLDSIDRIRSISDLIDFAAILNIRGGYDSVIFSGHIEQDEKESDRWVFGLSQGGITIGSPKYYVESNSATNKVRNAFREYLFNTFLRLKLDSSKAKVSADAVYDLETQLAQASYDGDEFQNIRITELSRLAPTINWNRYFQRIGIIRTDSLVMKKSRYFQSLDILLQKVPLDTWKDYMRFWLVKMNAPYLDDKAYGDFFAFDKTFTGAQRPRDRWQRMIRQVGRQLEQPIARLFIKKYYPANVKPRYQAMSESIRAALRDRITRLDWMSDTTKQKALLKLERMKMTIGFPDKWSDFSTMPLRRDSYVLNMIRANIWYHEQDIKKLSAPVDKSELDLSWTMRDDGSYNFSSNELYISPSFFVRVPGVGDEELDDAFVYGGPGAIVAHEISHGFDSNGRYFDAYGNKTDWWTEKDSAAFNERTEPLIVQYNEFMPLEGLQLDGKRTLPENIADLTGVRIALDAFKKTEQFRKNELVGGFTPLQRFFLAYAYIWAVQRKKEYITSMLQNGVHATDRERVNGVLVNIHEFYEAFNVKPGDRMFRPENARARIW